MRGSRVPARGHGSAGQAGAKGFLSLQATGGLTMLGTAGHLLRASAPGPLPAAPDQGLLLDLSSQLPGRGAEGLRSAGDLGAPPLLPCETHRVTLWPREGPWGRSSWVGCPWVQSHEEEEEEGEGEGDGCHGPATAETTLCGNGLDCSPVTGRTDQPGGKGELPKAVLRLLWGHGTRPARLATPRDPRHQTWPVIGPASGAASGAGRQQWRTCRRKAPC